VAKNILIIDDSDLVLAMASYALETAGYKVINVTNVIEANQYIFSKSQPDLIIIDVMMPLLNGDKKAKILKSDDITKHIPVLLMSSKNEDELKKLTFESGANGYIRKPFSPEDIVGRVDEFLNM
jgi:DNA-binding response OmpR family regulator